MSPSEDDSPFATACRASTRTEFICALNQLRLLRGLSFREVSINAGEFALAKSSAHAMCTDRPPKQEDKLRAFLTGCGEPAEALDGWVEQWRRVTASRANRRPHPAAQLVPSSARGFSPPE
ncbi:hypothetical protein ACFWN2_40810 [Lentzea sp. NPDC058436]|uniref:hypothetical protein n=1 Tax=Lentzea sp. NPDC058436 TaxID=3346499 RepID=UPI00365FA284